MNKLNNVTSNLVYNDFFDNVRTALTTLTGKIQGIALAVIILCIVLSGVMFLMGEEMSRNAKKWLGYIIIGALLIFGAATLGTTIQGLGGF